jgi:hypothetical protein
VANTSKISDQRYLLMERAKMAGAAISDNLPPIHFPLYHGSRTPVNGEKPKKSVSNPSKIPYNPTDGAVQWTRNFPSAN